MPGDKVEYKMREKPLQSIILFLYAIFIAFPIIITLDTINYIKRLLK